MNSFQLRVIAQVLPFLLIAPGLASAQTGPSRSEATAALKGAPQAAATQYTRQQIDQMIAPIALYPDQLLGQVLMAATYPQQLAEAAQWLNDANNAALKDDALVAALEPLAWDPSVKALVVFPQIVVMMTEHIEWTQALGVAFATQQAQVMGRVQALRQLAVKSGQINKVKHLAVRREGPVIVIASAEPERVFVPVYNPTVVYGAWPERSYPPVYLPPPRGYALETVEPGFEVSPAYRVVGPLWGWARPDWRSEQITVNTVEYTRITRSAPVAPGNTWRHQGPVVLVAPPAPRTTTVTATVPAGTVAPAGAAAVTALPQRAASQPNVIRVEKSPAQPTATAQPAPTTTPAQPQPGQTPGTTAQPATTPSGQTPAATAQPSQAKPPQAPAAAAQPGQGKPSQTPAATAQPSSPPNAPKQATTAPAAPGKGQASETAKPAESQADKAKPGGQPERASGGKPEAEPRPGKEHAATPAAPSKPATATATPGKPAEPAAKTAPQQAATPPATPSQSQAPHAPGAAHPTATALPGSAHAPPERPAPAAAAQSKPPSGTPPATAHTGPAAAPSHAPERVNAPERANAQAPQHPAATPPTGAPPAAAARRPGPPVEASGQGTSSPQAPKAAAPSAQQPHAGQERAGQERAGQRPGTGRGEDNKDNKKD